MKRYIAAGIFITAVLIGIIFYFRSQMPSDYGIPEGLRSKGPDTASVVIFEFSNFECHSCADSQLYLKEILKKYPEKIKLVFRHYPNIPIQHSLWAHISAECAARKGKFWEYHDKLFENQKEWSVSPDPLAHFLRYAKELGIDPKEFGDCISDERILMAVKQEDREGMNLGIKTTPTFVINGQYVVGIEQFKQRADKIVELELRKRGEI